MLSPADTANARFPQMTVNEIHPEGTQNTSTLPHPATEEVFPECPHRHQRLLVHLDDEPVQGMSGRS